MCYSVAGSHTTSSTITLLLSHLLANPDILTKVVKEIDTLGTSEPVVPYSGLEAKLPYLRACIYENFRIAPTTSFPLQRRITKETMTVCGQVLPKDVGILSVF